MRAIIGVVKEEYDLGIVRYQNAFEKYFFSLFEEKKLNYQAVNEFAYVMLLSKNNPLAKKDVILAEDLKNCIEITHGDPYVPSLPLIDVKRAELSEFSKKRIMVFERGVQFTLLEQVPNTFMWISSAPKELLDKFNLVERKCEFNTKTYKDVLIYRKKYHLTKLDNELIGKIMDAKHKYFFDHN